MLSIGQKIRVLRKSKNISQEELGLEIGVSRQTISKWEANTMNPNTENIKQLCDVFGVTADYFISDEEIAVTDTTEKIVAKNRFSKKLLMSLTAILSIINGFLIIVVAIVGKMAFPTNEGDYVVIMEGVHPNIFFSLCAALVGFIIAEIVSIVLLIKSKKQM